MYRQFVAGETTPRRLLTSRRTGYAVPVNKKWGGQPSAAPDSLARDARIWWNGSIVPAGDVRVGVLTHTLHYGYGLFEGIRAYRQADGTSAVFRLGDHVDRIFDGAKILNLQMPYSAEELRKACVETLEANGLAEAYVRPLVFIGEGKMGIYAPDNPVQISIAVWEWGAYLGEDALRLGVRACVSSFTRTMVNTNMVRAKVTGQYVTSILAKSEAMSNGCDEGILLDKDGYCAEGSGENLFIVRDGVLITPPLSSPILAGITRDSVLTIARDLKIPVEEDRFTRDDLYLSDEAFFTGTAAEVTPIREVDGRMVGAGERGPVTTRLQEEFFRVLRGEETRRPDWRTVYRV